MSPPLRAAVMPAPQAPLELRELPRSALEPGAAMLRTLYSEVCGRRHARLVTKQTTRSAPEGLRHHPRCGRRAPRRLGQSVAVLGAGPVGHAAAALASMERREVVNAVIAPGD